MEDSSSSRGQQTQAEEEEDSQVDSEEDLGLVPPKLERVADTVSESGNSSPSREVANILSVEELAYEES